MVGIVQTMHSTQNLDWRLSGLQQSEQLRTSPPLLSIAMIELEYIIRFVGSRLFHGSFLWSNLCLSPGLLFSLIKVSREKTEEINRQTKRQVADAKKLWGNDFWKNDPLVAPLRGGFGHLQLDRWQHWCGSVPRYFHEKESTTISQLMRHYTLLVTPRVPLVRECWTLSSKSCNWVSFLVIVMSTMSTRSRKTTKGCSSRGSPPRLSISRVVQASLLWVRSKGFDSLPQNLPLHAKRHHP